MTVHELRRLLEGVPAEWRVVGRGYESGFDDVTLTKEVLKAKKGPFYDGAYQASTEEDGGEHMIALK